MTKTTLCLTLLCISVPLLAAVNIPGTDQSADLETIGDIAKTIDNVIFNWGAKIAAAVVFLLGGWAVKENRLGMALLCFSAGFIILFAPKMAEEVSNMSGAGSLFSTGEGR